MAAIKTRLSGRAVGRHCDLSRLRWTWAASVSLGRGMASWKLKRSSTGYWGRRPRRNSLT